MIHGKMFIVPWNLYPVTRKYDVVYMEVLPENMEHVTMLQGNTIT